MAYKGKFIYEIKLSDVGKQIATITCSTCGHKRRLNFKEILGQVLMCDVGKRIYEVSGIYQIENTEQFTKRIKTES